MTTIEIVNPGDRDWTRHRYLLWMGMCAPTYLLVWANGLEDALETAADWAADHAPGLLCAEDEIADLFKEAREDLLADDPDREQDEDFEAEVWEHATANVDVLDQGRYIGKEEWGIVREDPTRADVLAVLDGDEGRVRA